MKPKLDGTYGKERQTQAVWQVRLTNWTCAHQGDKRQRWVYLYPCLSSPHTLSSPGDLLCFVISEGSTSPLSHQGWPHPRVLSKSHLINITKDTSTTLNTEKIPRAWGALGQKWGRRPNIYMSLINHNITKALPHLRVKNIYQMH